MNAFDSCEFEKHKQEVKEKWGETAAYKEYAEKSKLYSDDRKNDLIKEMNAIFAGFSECKDGGNEPQSSEAQELVRVLQKHITENYYNCTDDILSGLGQMYVFDERFKNNIDKFGEGTAEYVRKAIECYCDK
ncbi:MAG: TipAS antibiotic-recognition domain-containing protein [Clostridia bacterium]|nr:TipAS antibiotic-recognition domain-containing protein [Clostridia bacterium]